MGQEISSTQFSVEDFSRFRRRLEEETRHLETLVKGQGMSQRTNVGGFEIEAWLVNPRGEPAPVNQALLDSLRHPLVVPELAAFNIELNIEPHHLRGDALSRMQQSLERTWQQCREAAQALNARVMMVGILPSVREEELSLPNMTRSNRYQALNEQVLKLRDSEPLHLDIVGQDTLRTEHYDVMLESATTSFQIHLQLSGDNAVRMFNRASRLSGPMVAACANSPFLFGRSLWDETRIPLFEQSVECGEMAHRRVTFGDHYLQHSLFELFEENLRAYPVLVPFSESEEVSRMEHLRFHNGTIWRWNRPLIGFDEDGTPHWRLEHRVTPAGPTVPDSIANAALFYGMLAGLEQEGDQAMPALDFAVARDNFYRCAKDGLRAELQWSGGQSVRVRDLLLEQLLPLARRGLEHLGIDSAEGEHFLGLMKKRLASGRNGAQWQRDWVGRYGKDMPGLSLAYLEQQDSGKAVCDWPC